MYVFAAETHDYKIKYLNSFDLRIKSKVLLPIGAIVYVENKKLYLRKTKLDVNIKKIMGSFFSFTLLPLVCHKEDVILQQ